MLSREAGLRFLPAAAGGGQSKVGIGIYKTKMPLAKGEDNEIKIGELEKENDELAKKLFGI